jgi:DNA repair protein RadC
MDAEKLLAILMRIGQPGQNVTELARRLLLAAGGLEALAHMTYLEITGLRVPGIGEVKAMELEAAFELGRRAASGAAAADPRKVRSAKDVFEIMEPIVRGARQESFYVLILDARGRLVGQPVKVATGSHDRCPAGATEIFGAVMRRGCTAAIIAHNHPSGDPSPSREDLNVTTRLSDAAKILGIRLMDHVIIGRRTDASPCGYTSMAEGGMLQG